jgi:hypothetical protein
MATHKKYDARVDSLVIESKTEWDPEIGEIPEEDKRWLASAVHRDAANATKIEYERAHTGFTRQITVTVADIERLYQEKFAG